MKTLRKTKIVGTIGPASENKLEELFDAGLNVTRVNYSHGSWDEQKDKTETILRLREEKDIPVALLLDMKGPEIRTGMLYTGKNTKIQLKDGQKFTLVNEDITGDEEKVSVTYKELYKDVKPGTKILIDDGAIELKVDEVVGKDIVCTVVHGNGLGSRKTMNLPGTVIRLPGLAEKDIADLKTACEHGYDFVAISFARNADDINQVRKVLDENGGKDIQIITKVENVEGLSNMETIVNLADGQMIARGDMATETDFTEPPVMQKKFIKMCNKQNKPAITATQMLESMTHQPLPTRAEASDVANAIYDRTSAIMLSGECAQGDYPVECVQTMVKIANRVEPEINYWKRFDENENIELDTLEKNVAYATCVTAKNIKADAIVCYTHSGNSARNLAGLGAGCPILAITDNRRTFNQLALAWNVTPVFVEAKETINKTIEAGIEKLKNKEILEKGDLVIIAGGEKILKEEESSVNKTIGGILKV
ncbi:MAG: pyruvate kinase [Clostridia bacterium]